MTHDELRKRHYKNLNYYRELPGYTESRQSYEAMQAFFAQIVGHRWEIDEEIYDDFLNMLPPLGWSGGAFYMREFTFDDITTRFSKSGGKYFCEFARFPGRVAA
jgi:hypothetical protein